MSETPALTVITPVRNMARFVGETLDSVAALETDHEHLVFDAASDDGTTEVLASRDDPGLKWVSEPDRGQTHAVNKGLEAAHGRAIGWLNGDDAYVPEAVDRAVDHLLSSPEAMAIYGGIELIDEHGGHIRTHIPARFSWRRYLYFNYPYPTPTFIFKRELLAQAPSLNEEFADAADYEFYLRLFRGQRIDRRPEPLVRFRYHDESKSTADVWTQLDEALEIRLRWARNPLGRLIMSGSERARRAILPRISNWPHPEPSPLVKASEGVSKWRRR
jgi:glycosyltransferase involved in cell wall biosynthesis